MAHVLRPAEGDMAGMGLASVYLAVLLDCMGAMMVLPLLPFFAETFQASAFVVGFMQALYSFMQIFGTLLLGSLADSFGRERVLLVSLLSSAMALTGFANALTLSQLVLFRGLNGFFAGTVSVCQAIVADMTSEEERPSKMAMIMAAYGLGVVVGPALAGFIAPYGFPAVSLTAAGLTFANFLLALWQLPRSPAASSAGGAAAETSPPESTVGMLREVAAYIFSDAIFATMCTINFLQSVNIGVLLGICGLFVKDRYGMGPADLGEIFCVAGVAMVLAQGFLTTRAVEAFGQQRCILLGSALRLGGFAFIAGSGSPAVPWCAPPVIIAAGALIDPCTASLVSAHAPPGTTGSVLGAFQSLGSLGSFLGPLLAGATYRASPTAPFWIAAALSGASMSCVLILARSLGKDRGVTPPDEEDAGGVVLRRMSRSGSTPVRAGSSMLQFLHTDTLSIPPIALAVPELYSPHKQRQRSSPLPSHEGLIPARMASILARRFTADLGEVNRGNGYVSLPGS